MRLIRRETRQPESASRPWCRRLRWDWSILAVLSPATLAASLAWPDQGSKVARVSWDFFLEMLSILPAVLVLMGLFAVWVSRETVVKYLGEGSGIKGLLLSMLLGALPTGPLYIAFPMGAMLVNKGARVANVMAFLSAWACIKLPQELVEFQFMGWRFALTRLLVTALLIAVLCLVAEWIYNRFPEKEMVTA
ncbi:MAG: permease [Actinomycetota bacterium]|nr:permease [Actinomycetota bacterium]